MVVWCVVCRMGDFIDSPALLVARGCNIKELRLASYTHAHTYTGL